jgi:hypothetical protein
MSMTLQQLYTCPILLISVLNTGGGGGGGGVGNRFLIDVANRFTVGVKASIIWLIVFCASAGSLAAPAKKTYVLASVDSLSFHIWAFSSYYLGLPFCLVTAVLQAP